MDPITFPSACRRPVTPARGLAYVESVLPAVTALYARAVTDSLWQGLPDIDATDPAWETGYLADVAAATASLVETVASLIEPLRRCASIASGRPPAHVRAEADAVALTLVEYAEAAATHATDLAHAMDDWHTNPTTDRDNIAGHVTRHHLDGPGHETIHDLRTRLAHTLHDRFGYGPITLPTPRR